VSAQGETGDAASAARHAAAVTSSETAVRVVLVLIALLVAKRLAYHLTYIVADAFALATFSDGQVYEDAARDILLHPPFGSQPFYLQGLYAYMLALPMALAPQVVVGLVLQLVLAAGALWLFHRAATSQLGELAGGLSTLCLLAFAELAFYENKYLSVSLGVGCNIVALWAACRALREGRFVVLLVAGVCAGLSVLGRPNMVLAVPCTLAALVLCARGERRRMLRAVAGFSLGVLLAVGPMALRNAIVVGRPDLFPSHAGAIPFFIGNNPHANGRWNTAGGLLSGQVGRERFELAQRLGLDVQDPAELDRAIGAALLEKGKEYIRTQPRAWLGLELKKLWNKIGNHRFVRDYDVLGEAELIGKAHELGLPFGVLLALGSLGLCVLWRRARAEREERVRWMALLIVLLGQVFAVLAANLVIFASAQNRVPLSVPLAFASGPALLALFARARRLSTGFEAAPIAIALSLALLAQSFWPRLPTPDQPSSFHYFNLAAVEEAIGRDEAAALHYGRAAKRNPREPMFQLRQAGVLRRLGRTAEAGAVLDRLDVLRDVPEAVRSASAQERTALRAQQRPPD
jgi:4-amino-4-deoxy-L-arabinose transferase-like glycosyltransferase